MGSFMNVSLRPIKEAIIGGHMHRSGWPYVLRSLQPQFDDNAVVVFDDFLEKTVCNQRIGLDRHIHKSPWVGICHYPFDAPEWYETEHLQDLPNRDSWSQSLAHLRLCITLGENLAGWVQHHWNVNCVCIKHPTETPTLTWTEEHFRENEKPLLLQVGWYLRNTHAIFQVDAPSFLTKAWLRSRREIADINHARCQEHFHTERVRKGYVRQIEPVDNDEYDRLLSENAIFVELITSVANNTVIECIARNTPIVVNRLAGPKYYLGEEYPLFYDNLSEIRSIVTEERIMIAHEYLSKLDKAWIDGSAFRNSLVKACVEHVPEISANANVAGN
jgi:hypothetical protein